MIAALTTIFSSASKIVFLMIALTICAAFLIGKLTQDNMMYIATSVFSYYFGVTVGGLPDASRANPPADPPAPTLPIQPTAPPELLPTAALK